MRSDNENQTCKVLVWDLPVRLFHWSLVGAVALAWLSAEQGRMGVHLWCGYAILVLVSFRLLWGFSGSTHARFSDFVRGPRAILRYLSAPPLPGQMLGHNPLGGWSVLALLALLLAQAGSGLFANDDISTYGPLYEWVSSRTSRLLTRLHHLNFNILLALVALHISAIVFYRLVKGEDLIHPMLHGYKAVECSDVPPARAANPWLALGLLGVCAAAWYGVLFVRF